MGVCHFKECPHKDYWPHYLLLSFYLFVGVSLFMIIVSLLTRHSHGHEDLPTLKEIYARQGKAPTFVWLLWGILALIMLAIYIVFN